MRLSCWVLLVAFVLAGSARAALISVNTTTTGNNVTLNSITTSEGTFTAAQLIQVDVTHFKGSNTTVIVRPEGDPLPPTGGRAALLEDLSLSTAVVNFGGSATAGITAPPVINDPTPANNSSGLAINFATPIKNVAGQTDIVLFELVSTAQNPDPFAVSLLDGSAQKAYVAADYTVAVASTTLRTGLITPAPGSLALLENSTMTSNTETGSFSYQGVGIDLSDLGVPDGGSVSGLFFTSGSVDVGLIVGLHPVPEPSVVALLALAAGPLLMRRRR